MGVPSRSRMRPVLVDGTPIVRGCTKSSTRLGPDQLAAHQADRVRSHGAHRADRDDAAPRGRDRELLAVLRALAQAGHGQLCQTVADRDLDLHAEHASRRGVVDGDLAARRLPHDHSAVGEPQDDVERRAADQVQHGDEGEHQSRPGDQRPTRPSPAGSRRRTTSGITPIITQPSGVTTPAIRAPMRPAAAPSSAARRTTVMTASASTPSRAPTMRVRVFVRPAPAVCVSASGCATAIGFDAAFDAAVRCSSRPFDAAFDAVPRCPTRGVLTRLADRSAARSR